MTVPAELGNSSPKIIFGQDMPDFEPNTAKFNTEFHQIIDGEISAKKWYDYSLILKQAPSDTVQASVQDHLKSLYPGLNKRNLSERLGFQSDVFVGSQFSWETVPQFTGDQFHVAILDFSSAGYSRFLAKAGLPLAQGYSFQLDIEDDMRPFSLVTLSRDPIPGFMSPDQIKEHEKIHSIDPLLHLRTFSDGPLLTEMIATIGEITQGTSGMLKVRTEPSFWLKYLDKIKYFSNDFLRLIRLNKENYTNQDIAQNLSDFVYKATAKVDNADLVLSMMSSRNFQELLPKTQKMLPDFYQE